MKKLSSNLNKVEEKLAQEVIELGGFRPSDIVRIGLRLMHETYVKKRGPGRPPIPDDDAETAEQWCERQGGKLIIENGLKFCLKIDGPLERKIPVPGKYI